MNKQIVKDITLKCELDAADFRSCALTSFMLADDGRSQQFAHRQEK